MGHNPEDREAPYLTCYQDDLRVVQVVQRKVGRDDQRLGAAVTAVNHIEHLFQPVFLSLIHI